MESLGWRQRRGSSSAARRGARQRAGLTPVSASNILSCERETHQTSSGRSNSLDADHGIYRDHRGQVVTSPAFSLLNRPTPRYFPEGIDFDAFGIPTSDLDVIKDGVLN